MKNKRLSVIGLILAIGTMFPGPSDLRAQALPAGLVAAYAFEEGGGSSTADASGNSNTGAVNGATWTASGKFGNALSFDGSNDRVDINDAASLDLTAGMTLEAWVYPTTLSGWRTAVLKESPGGLAYALYAHDDAPRPAAYINTGGGDLSVAGTASLATNTWSHVAATYDGTTFRLFVNGSQAGSAAITGTISASTSPLRIGGNTIWGEYFSGRIDEVRVYNRALSQAEIQTDMNTAVTVPVPDTTAPSAPADLTATAAGSSRIDLSWTAATDDVGVTGYEVERCEGSGCASFAQIATTTTTTYGNTGLSASTSYTYRVRAVDAANNLSGYSATASAVTLDAGVEPTGWYAGDPHVHRSCGGSAEAISSIFSKMAPQQLSVISLLADMGNGEVQDPETDLPLVTGLDDPVSTSGQTVHWDAEWHWDAVYSQYEHQALGGHIVALGLSEAHQIWDEYTYPILDWAHQQNAIAGFVHMQYLDDNIPDSLNCCIPIEYPVEVALGAADFISEDVNGGESAVRAYYRLLNTGFRPSFTAGTDYPCGVSELGSLLTYVQVRDGAMTYTNWVDGIAKGRTVVSRNGHHEFLDLSVNYGAGPGDELKLTAPTNLPVTVTWTADRDLSGTIELVHDGVVAASMEASVSSGSSASLSTTVNFTKSGWLTARRMEGNEHQVHTGAVFIVINDAPVRASVDDAEFYVQWMDNLLERTSPGGSWSSYFADDRAAAQARYQAAKSIYEQIALEAAGQASPVAITSAFLPGGDRNVAYSATLTATGGLAPYAWSIADGALPPGLSLSSSTGVIAGTPVSAGTFSFTAQVIDSGAPAQSATAGLSITVSDADSVAIATNSLPGGAVNSSYSGALTATGGTLPYLWSLSSGTLPAGLSLDESAGVISGTASAAGTFSFIVQVGDSGIPQLTATKAFSIVIGQNEPILIITSASNPFSGYYEEILRTEGFNELDVLDISSLSSAVLAPYDVVLLGNVALAASQVSMLGSWVDDGGHLIAMRPDKQLAGLLGLVDQASTLANAYLLVNTGAAPGAGIVDETIQFHGTADKYLTDGASSLATLYSSSADPTVHPAVTLKSAGTRGGRAAAFTYDLARSVVQTRQGNPSWAGQERDGSSPIRSDDLFYGAASFDPQADWIDLNKVEIPQADEQQRLLANLIIFMNSDKKPLPRFWYLPRGLTATVVMTGDDHNGGGTDGRFDDYLSLGPSGCSVEDWECIRGTSYVYPDNGLTNSQASVYNSAGFEIAAHINTDCDDWTPSSLESFFSSQLDDWTGKYSSLPPPVTNRVHCIAYSDYSTMPTTELRYGIRLDTNYYFWPPDWVDNRPGFFTGSGMPMRFTDAKGELIDVYQAATQLTDESGQSYPYTVDTLLDRATGPEGYYGVFTANMHTDSVESSGSDAIVGSARDRGIPVVSARQMLEWLDGRNASTFNAIAWNGDVLGFTVSAGPGSNGLTAMVPLIDSRKVSTVMADSGPVAFSMKTVKGVQYAVFTVTDGAYEVAFAQDTDAPLVNSVSPADGSSEAGTATTVDAVFSEAMDPATISASTMELRSPSNEPVTATVTYDGPSSTATLVPSEPLAYSTTYTAVVKGGTDGVKDLAGNALAGDVTWSFTTVSSSAARYTLWPATTTPGVADAGSDNPVELGVKFRSDTDGYVTGIRFYKGSANTGAHVGNLWTAAGELLATAVFTNETASGWQQADFSAPVAVTAGTIYVASYHCAAGHYSDDQYYFSGSGVDSPPLHSPSDGESGANGVYAYGSTSSFPSQGWLSSNYWVDLVFRP